MAVQPNTVDADDSDDLDELDGHGLRGRLERELREKRNLEAQIVSMKAKEILAENGFDLVKPEDLKGAKLEELESKAKALQDDRLNTARAVVRNRLERQGLEGDDLEAAVDEFFGGEAPKTREQFDDEDAAAGRRARTLPVGNPAPRGDPDRLHGFDAIAAGLQATSKPRSSRSS